MHGKLYLFKSKTFGAFDRALKLNLCRFLTAAIAVNRTSLSADQSQNDRYRQFRVFIELDFLRQFVLSARSKSAKLFQSCRFLNVRQRTARAMKWRSLSLANQRDLKVWQLHEVD
jgi:hypothetical protein